MEGLKYRDWHGPAVIGFPQTDRVTPILIVSRNSLALTKKAVASALAQDSPVEVLLVDNASTDGTQEWANTKPISTIFTMEQWSLSKCWNVGLQFLWEVGHDAALVINSDIEMRPDTARLLRLHGGQFVTAVSVDTREAMEGPRDLQTLWNTGSPHPCFSLFLIRKTVTDQIGFFNEEYFPAYVEDSEMHVRMHRAGIVALAVDLPFYHYSCGTLKSASHTEKMAIERGASANRERFKKTYGCYPGTAEYDRLFE